MRSRAASLLLTTLAACAPAPAAVDAASGAADAGTDAAEPADASTALDTGPRCDVSPAPADLVALTGEFVPLDADAGSPIPVQTGGDPTGVWRIDHVTFYTAPETAGMYDPAGSSIDGTAWVVVDATELRMELHFDLTLAGTPAGTIRRLQTTDIRGTYTTNGAMLMLTPECVAPAPMTPSSGLTTTFSAGPSDGTLVLTTSGMLGATTLVLSGTRTPS